MKIIIKKLQGGECNLEVLPTTTILEIKSEVSEKLNIPVEEQKLLLLGRTLADDQTVQTYPTIRDGSKLNLVVKKPDTQEIIVKYFKDMGMSHTDAANAAKRFSKILQEKFDQLSWDDVDRLCSDCLSNTLGRTQPPPPIDNEPEPDDSFGL